MSSEVGPRHGSIITAGNGGGTGAASDSRLGSGPVSSSETAARAAFPSAVGLRSDNGTKDWFAMEKAPP